MNITGDRKDIPEEIQKIVTVFNVEVALKSVSALVFFFSYFDTSRCFIFSCQLAKFLMYIRDVVRVYVTLSQF